MTTVPLQAAPAAVLRAPLRRTASLRADLADTGIPMIPDVLVQKYKQDELDDTDETGVMRVFTVIDRLLWIPRGYFIPRLIEWATGRQYGLAHFTLTVVLFAASFIGPWAGHTWSWLLAVPLLAAVPSSLGLAFAYAAGGRYHHMGSWRHCRINDGTRTAGMDFDLVEVSQPPSRLRDRIRRLQQLPGVSLLINYRGSDPFVIAVSTWKPWQRAYVGAWDTYSDLDYY